MSDNVILLGAGASYDAGIPLLSNFMERMTEMAITGRSPNGTLNPKHAETLQKVLRIRDSIETYHARVSVDQFNIEQILSVLSFEAFCGSRAGKKNLSDFTRAISLAIELCCNVKHTGDLLNIQDKGASIYRSFWSSLIELWKYDSNSLPTIISFNYDLVLERSLFQLLIGHRYPHTLPGVSINYANALPVKTTFATRDQTWGYGHAAQQGKTLNPVLPDALPSESFNVKLLKLHGSLNFPSIKGTPNNSFLLANENPQIIPPVFNKTESTFGTPIWKAALHALRTCKSLVVCGYSLPMTDTYMQYFLKAALGPNRNLHKISVFDPALHSGTSNGTALRERYDACFSEQFRNRINFQPMHEPMNGLPGTFAHMVKIFKGCPSHVFFGL